VKSAAQSKLPPAAKSLERALLAGHTRPDRLPGLQVIFGQLPRSMVEQIGNLSLLPLKARLIDVGGSTLGEACTLQPNALAGAVRAERWRSWLYFISDPMATLLFVEAATGCEGFSNALTTRAPTKTDKNLVRVLFRRLARALASAFSLLVDVTFDVGAVVDKIELEPQLSPTSHVITAKMALEYAGHTGVVTIVIPQAALEQIRDLLATATPGDANGAQVPPSKFRDDSAWAKQLSEEISRAFISLNGVLEERPITLGEVQKFTVGSVVELSSPSLSKVRLEADNNPLFWCELGKRDGALILRVEDDFDRTDAVDEFYGL
jgi:flagellar motor switch protein FliM